MSSCVVQVEKLAFKTWLDLIANCTTYRDEHLTPTRDTGFVLTKCNERSEKSSPPPPLVGGFFNLKAWLPLGRSILLGTPMSKYYLQFHPPLTNIEDPGGYSWEFVVRVPRPVLQILTLFQIKKTFHFPCRFETWRLRSITVFRPGVNRNYVIITWIRRPTKRFLKILVELAYYFFFMINMELKR